MHIIVDFLGFCLGFIQGKKGLFRKIKVCIGVQEVEGKKRGNFRVF